MKVLNLIWGFSLGAGIDKCFISYSRLGEIDSSVEVLSVCIKINNINSELKLLKDINATLINIENKKDFSWVSKLASFIEEKKPDVIFTHGFNGAIMMLILKLFKGMKVPIVCSYHGLYHAATKAKKILKPIYNFLPRLIYKYIAIKVICVERASYNFLIKKGVPENKIEIVYNGIPEKVAIDKNILAINKTWEGKIKLITVSSLFPVKGLNYLLDAIALIKSEVIYPFHYINIGEGPEFESLKQKSIELKINDLVSFVGYQSNIPSWLEICDIYILPSLSECHSIALLEAMRAGKSIVATNVGGNPESIRDGIDGILVPPRNAESLAKNLIDLINNPQKRVDYEQSAHGRFNELFTEKIMQNNLIRALKL